MITSRRWQLAHSVFDSLAAIAKAWPKMDIGASHRPKAGSLIGFRSRYEGDALSLPGG
jgi:hypothetical protein